MFCSFIFISSEFDWRIVKLWARMWPKCARWCCGVQFGWFRYWFSSVLNLTTAICNARAIALLIMHKKVQTKCVCCSISFRTSKDPTVDLGLSRWLSYEKGIFYWDLGWTFGNPKLFSPEERQLKQRGIYLPSNAFFCTIGCMATFGLHVSIPRYGKSCLVSQALRPTHLRIYFSVESYTPLRWGCGQNNEKADEPYAM